MLVTAGVFWENRLWPISYFINVDPCAKWYYNQLLSSNIPKYCLCCMFMCVCFCIRPKGNECYVVVSRDNIISNERVKSRENKYNKSSRLQDIQDILDRKLNIFLHLQHFSDSCVFIGGPLLCWVVSIVNSPACWVNNCTVRECERASNNSRDGWS